MFKIFSCSGRITSPTIYLKKNLLLPKFFSKNKNWKRSEVYAHSSQNSILQVDQIQSREEFQSKDFSTATNWKNEEFFGFFHEYSSILQKNQFLDSVTLLPNKGLEAEPRFIDSLTLTSNQKLSQTSLGASITKNFNEAVFPTAKLRFDEKQSLHSGKAGKTWGESFDFAQRDSKLSVPINLNLRYSSRNIARILFAFFFDHSKKNFPLGSVGFDKKKNKIIPTFEILHSFSNSLTKPAEKAKNVKNLVNRGIRNLTRNESFPSIRIQQRKIPLLPFFFCLLPYILFLGIRQSFSLLSSSNSIEDFLLMKNPLFPTEKTSLPRIFHSNSVKQGNGNMERKIRRLMSSHKAFSQFQRNMDQSKNGDILVDQSFAFENQNWILSFPSSLSKFFVVWAIQKIASIRPQRRMTEKAEQSQQARVLFPHEISVKFENLQGLTAVLPLLNLFIESLHTGWLRNGFKLGFQKKKVFKDQESKYPKGYLFVGPPGTGKTQLAQALAKEANVPLLCVSASEIQKQIEIGTRIGGLRLRKIFEKAREYAPCILFFDEIDAIGKTRGQQGSGDSQLLTEFLIQMDSFSVRDGFVVVGTTNFLSNLDSAFIRSGRFDRILNLHSPSKKIRLDILQSAVSKKNLSKKNEIQTGSPKIPWKYFAHYTENFSPAHLARLVNESFLYSCQKSISSSGLSQSVFSKKIHHTFESLQHGFHRIQNHRKNFL